MRPAYKLHWRGSQYGHVPHKTWLVPYRPCRAGDPLACYMSCLLIGRCSPAYCICHQWRRLTQAASFITPPQINWNTLHHIHCLPSTTQPDRPYHFITNPTKLYSARRVLRLKCSESKKLILRLHSPGMWRYVSRSVVRYVSAMGNAETS